MLSAALRAAIFFSFLAGFCGMQEEAAAGVADPMAVAIEIKSAIMKAEPGLFIKHMQGSTYFVDELYTKKDLTRLFYGKENWLRRNLFLGEGSVKAYFNTAQDLKIVLMTDGREDVISYQSSNYPPHMWPWCSIRAKGKSWVFCDMFGHR